MNYLILSAIVIGISYIYEKLNVEPKLSKGARISFYVLICFFLCLFAGLRTAYNDTYAYIEDFKNTTNDFLSLFAEEFSISSVYLFKIWNFIVFNSITHNANIYLFLSSILFVFPAVYLIDKYSKKFTFSIMLFMFGGLYLFSLAGLKQAMATGVVLLGLPNLFKKEYVRYYICCILSLGFHAYSMFFLLVPLLGVETFNKRTIVFCILTIVVGIFLSFFSEVITAIVEFLGKEISEEKLQEGSVNILRVAIFLIPFVLSVVGRKKLVQATDSEKWLIKIATLSTMFMVLALFGNPILFGRIPQYFLIGIVIAMPLLIEKVFGKEDQPIVVAVLFVCYLIFGLYELYIDGAFSRDIFQLIFF